VYYIFNYCFTELHATNNNYSFAEAKTYKRDNNKLTYTVLLCANSHIGSYRSIFSHILLLMHSTQYFHTSIGLTRETCWYSATVLADCACPVSRIGSAAHRGFNIQDIQKTISSPKALIAHISACVQLPCQQASTAQHDYDGIFTE